jgi:hypothetical protein
MSLHTLMDSEASTIWLMSPPSVVDRQTLDGVHEKSPAALFATTQAVDIPEAQDSGSLLKRWL